MNELFKCRPIAKDIAHNVHRNYMVGNIIREKGFIYQIQKPTIHAHIFHSLHTHAFKFHSLKEATELMFHTEQNVNTKHYVIDSNRLTLKQIRPVGLIERISGDKIIKMAHNPASAV